MSTNETHACRESNIELLRIVIMAFIVLHHFLCHGLGTYHFDEDKCVLSPLELNLSLSVESFFIIAVDVFVLISGYFSIRLKARSFVKLFMTCVFYLAFGCIVYYATADLVSGPWMIEYFLKRTFCVISGEQYWFIRIYFLLVLISGMLNKYVEAASKKHLLSTIGIFSFISIYIGWMKDVWFVDNGYNIINFILLYFVGRYLRLYFNNKYSAKRYLSIYIVASTLTAILAVSLVYIYGGIHKHPMWAFHYNSPLVIISSIAFFLCFTKLQFRSKWINYVAASSLAIYLMQEGVYGFYDHIGDMYQDTGFTTMFFLEIIVLFIISMTVPVVIDKLRGRIFSGLENKVTALADKYIFSKFFDE